MKKKKNKYSILKKYSVEILHAKRITCSQGMKSELRVHSST